MRQRSAVVSGTMCTHMYTGTVIPSTENAEKKEVTELQHSNTWQFIHQMQNEYTKSSECEKQHNSCD